jgi:hypothetical protein
MFLCGCAITGELLLEHRNVPRFEAQKMRMPSFAAATFIDHADHINRWF